MSIDDPRLGDETVNGVMATLYRQLDNYVPDGETPYDVKSGLEQLMERLDAGQEASSIAVSSRSPLQKPAAVPVTPAGEPLQPADYSFINELALSERLAAERNALTTRAFFGGIVVFAAATLGIMVSSAWPTAVIVAMAAMVGIVGAAGVLMARASTAVIRRLAKGIIIWAGNGPHPQAAQQQRSEQRADSETRPITINGGVGRLEISRPRNSPARSVRFRARTVTLFLAGLTVACVAGLAVSIIGLTGDGTSLPYVIGLFVPSGTSILLLLTSWWWRVVDRRNQRGDGAETVTSPSSSALAEVSEFPLVDEDVL